MVVGAWRREHGDESMALRAWCSEHGGESMMVEHGPESMVVRARARQNEQVSSISFRF
jgi:hypothetical protein